MTPVAVAYYVAQLLEQRMLHLMMVSCVDATHADVGGALYMPHQASLSHCITEALSCVLAPMHSAAPWWAAFYKLTMKLMPVGLLVGAQMPATHVAAAIIVFVATSQKIPLDTLLPPHFAVKKENHSPLDVNAATAAAATAATPDQRTEAVAEWLVTAVYDVVCGPQMHVIAARMTHVIGCIRSCMHGEEEGDPVCGEPAAATNRR